MTIREIRFGLRSLARRPGFSLVSVTTLAIGIGLTSMMFSVIDGLFLQGLPFEEQDRLVRIQRLNVANDFSLGVSAHDYADFRERQTHFSAMAAFSGGTANISDGRGEPERVDGEFVEHSFFEVLRVEPILGQRFRPEESLAGAPRKALLTKGLWNRRYNADPGIIGETITVNGELTEIVGVLPEGFDFPRGVDIYTNRAMGPLGERSRWGSMFAVMARLKPGSTLEAARTELVGISEVLAEAHPEANAGFRAEVEPLADLFSDGDLRTTTLVLFAATLFVLVIACVNVANLMLARTTLRAKELAIRTALGAGRFALMRLIVLESLLLAAAGAFLGLLLAQVGLALLENAIRQINLPSWIDIGLGGWSSLFVAGTSIAAGLFAGLLPALRASRSDVQSLLKDDTRTGSSHRAGRISRLLIVAQMALACSVLIATGLMLRTLWKLNAVELGFEADQIMTARIGLFAGDFPEMEDTTAYRDRLVRRLQAVPGVLAASAWNRYPGAGNNFGPEYRYVAEEGGDYPTEESLPVVRMNVVGDGFFDLTGVPLVRGEAFRPVHTAVEDSPRVALVNEGMATLLWPDQDPIGKRFRMPDGSGVESDPTWYRVIGIAPDLNMNGLNDNDSPGNGFYLSMRQHPQRFFTIAMRTDRDPGSLVAPLRSVIRELSPDQPIYWVETLGDRLEETIYAQVIVNNLFFVFGLTALFLACVGIYGVNSYAVNQRTQEIGIRMALGASSGRVLAMILRQGGLQVTLGVVFGLLLAWWSTPFLANILFEVDPRDLVTFSLVTGVLAAAGLLALLGPARRAARLHPMLALRHE